LAVLCWLCGTRCADCCALNRGVGCWPGFRLEEMTTAFTSVASGASLCCNRSLLARRGFSMPGLGWFQNLEGCLLWGLSRSQRVCSVSTAVSCQRAEKSGALLRLCPPALLPACFPLAIIVLSCPLALTLSSRALAL